MHRLILTACAALALIPAAASAGSFTATNDTAITAYSGNDPYAYFSGPNPYVAAAPVGAEFETASLTVQAEAQQGLVLVDFSYVTRFSGADMLDDTAVAKADIFLAAGSGFGTQGFTYAISLGQQTANGGLAAGFYSVGAAATSQSIWSSRPGFIFGGAFGANAAYLPGEPGYRAMAAPTVLTAGRLLSAVTVTETALAHGWSDLDAQIAMTPEQAAVFAGGMNVFWGTGDCANGSFLAELPGLPIPEPCSAALLVGAISFAAVRRKRKSGARSGDMCHAPQTPRLHLRQTGSVSNA